MRPLPSALGTALALLFAVLARPASANTIYVNQAQGQTIQAAIDSSNTFNGDIIQVFPGVYRENIDLKGKNLIITSTVATDTASQQAAAKVTIIDGGLLAPAVTSTTPLSTAGNGLPMDFPGPTISYFTIQNGGLPLLPGGANAADGGIYVTTAGDTATDVLHIVGNVFTNNQSGGVVIDGGLAYVYGNTFQQNICYGVLVHDGGAGVIYNNTITGTQTSGAGCVYQQFYQPPTMTNSSGILLDGGNSNDTENARSVIVGNTITNNVQIASTPNQLEGGAGIIIYSGSAYIESNTISYNTAVAARGGAIDIVGGDSIEIDNNVIANNAAGCGGGALSFNPGGLLNLDINPGNIFTAHYSLLAANNTLVNNYSTIGQDPSCNAAQQIQVNGVSSPAVGFVNNIISGNTSDPSVVCGQKSAPSIAHQPVFDHNLVFNSNGSFFDSSCVDESAAPLNNLFGNLIAQPTFANTGSNPYQLATSSEGIDAGNNGVLLSVATQEGFLTYQFSLYTLYYPDTLTPPYINPAAPKNLGPEDITGNLRFQDATGLMDQASQQLDIIDMGAYEARGTSSSADGIVTVFMPPTGYTDMPGPAKLFAEIVSGSAFDSVPPGTVTFFMDGTQVGDPAPITPIPSPLSPGAPAGNASVAVNFTPGPHVLTATYQPAPNQPVPKVPEAQSVAVVVDITSTPTTLKLAADPLSTDLGNTVTFTVTAPPDYAGYVPTPVSIINTNNNNAVIGTVTPDPKTGVGTLTTANNLFLGANDVQASFAGSGIYQPSVSNIVTVTLGLPSAVKITVSPAPIAQAFAPITFTAIVTGSPGTPTGSVIFYSDTAATQPINPAEVKNGVATLIAGLPGGTYNITAVYTGDATFGVATSNSVPETVLPDSTSLTLTSAVNPGIASQLIPLTATLATSISVVPGSLSDNPITFFSDGVSIGTAFTNTKGSATLEKAFPAGTYTLTAAFTADASLNASTSNSVIEVINQAAPTATYTTATTLAVTPNPGYPGGNETLTATVAITTPPSTSTSAPALTGTITFFDGSTMLASSPLDAQGSAGFSTTTFTIGTHTLTAVYSGDTTYQPSTSTPVILNILLSDFTLTADPSISIPTQSHKTLNLTLTSVGSFADTVSITCSNLPAYTTCNFPTGGTQASVQLAAGATATGTIDIDTDALLNFASTSHPPASPHLRNTIAFALLLPVTLFALRRKLPPGSLATRLFVALFALTLGATLTGCSGHYPGHTLPGTYNITITGKAQATGLTHSATVTLIVTQ